MSRSSVTADTITVEQVVALRCSICSRPAECVGRYDLDEDAPPEPACGECCGHGCEDGRCYLLYNDEGELREDALEWAAEAHNAIHGGADGED